MEGERGQAKQMGRDSETVMLVDSKVISGVSLKLRFPVRSSFYDITIILGCLLMRSSSCEVVFL